VSRSDGTDEEYRFDPEEFDGDVAPTTSRLDVVPVVVGGCIGLGGLLFLAEPFVDPVPVAGVRLLAVLLSVFVVAAGLLFGCAVYLRRGKRRIGLAHGVGGVG